MCDEQPYRGSVCIPRYDQPPPDWVTTTEQHMRWLDYKINGPEDIDEQETQDADA